MEQKLIKILVVDDDENVLQDIVRLFHTHIPVADVKTAATGAQACAFMENFLPNVVIVDIRMPGMDGVEVLRFIRNNQRYADVKIIVMTGLSEKDIKVSAIRGKGIREILYKPFPQEELIAAVKRVLAKSKTDMEMGMAT